MPTLNQSCDVLVAGGGVSGVLAALAAARGGANTVLIEKNSFLGGIGYSGLLHHICGLYPDSEKMPVELLNSGIVHEVIEQLNRLSPDKSARKIGRVYVLPYNREELKAVFNSLCEKESRLTVLYNTAAVAIEKRDGSIISVDINSSPGMLNPKVVIDCTGDGGVSKMADAGYSISKPEELQMAGYVLLLGGLQDIDEMLAVKAPYYLSKAVEEGILPEYFKFTAFSIGDMPGEVYCKINTVRNDQENQEENIKQDAGIMLRYLAEKVPAFKNTYIQATSLSVMDREGMRVCGEYTLTEEDVLSARKFEDGVVKNSWPIEIWDKTKGTVYKYLEPGEFYEIPFRCLKVKGISNLLSAGRCISVTKEALGSTRVMGTCMSLGEQAGMAAAYFVGNARYPFA